MSICILTVNRPVSPKILIMHPQNSYLNTHHAHSFSILLFFALIILYFVLSVFVKKAEKK